MERASAVALALNTRRTRGFWIASGLAALLPCLSWLGTALVRFFNLHLFHAAEKSSSGWWLYVAMRLGLTLLLVHTIWRFPQPPASDPSPAVRTPRKDRFFDPLMALRAFACLLVVMGHFFLVVFPFTNPAVLHGFAPLLRSCPWAGVWVFFTLSGFLMGKGFSLGRYSLDETGMRMFMRNRFLRIAPIYYGGLLVVSAFRYPLLFEPRNWWVLLEMSMFDYRGDLPAASIGALWSVSTEVQFYLLAPVLIFALFALQRVVGRGFIGVPLLLLLAGTAAKVFVNHHVFNASLYIYTPFLGNMDLFLFGLSLNLLPQWKARSPFSTRSLGLLLTVLMLCFYAGICFYSAGCDRTHDSLDRFWALWPAPIAFLSGLLILLAEALGKVRVSRGILGQSLLAIEWLGTLTYCIYVFHSDVFLSMATLFPTLHGLRISLQQFPLAIALTLAIAAIFYYLIEKPFDRKKKVGGTALTDAP